MKVTLRVRVTRRLSGEGGGEGGGGAKVGFEEGGGVAYKAGDRFDKESEDGALNGGLSGQA